MTLAEVVIAVAIGTILLLAVTSLAMYSGKSLAGLFNYVDMDAVNRVALDKMTREIRQAGSLAEFQTNRLTFVDYDGGKLVYEYFPAEKVLVRIKDGQEEVLLTECDSLAFAIFRRNTTSGTFNQTPMSSALGAKVISMNWTCSRKLLGAKANTEAVQSARIVVRKG